MNELKAASAARRHDDVERLAEKGLAIIDRAPPQQKAALTNYRIAMAYRLTEAGLQFVVADRALEAERPIKRALVVFEQIKEARPAAVAGAYAGLGYAYFTAGRDAEVEAPIKRALAILEKAYGQQIPESDATLVNYPWCWFL